MGMYTEIFFRAELIDNLPEEVETLLNFASAGLWKHVEATAREGKTFTHPFFRCERFSTLFVSSSYYFPASPGETRLYADPQIKHLLRINGSFKNYDGEIAKFFDWIDPYVRAEEGEFLGYQLYEEGNQPVLYFKKES